MLAQLFLVVSVTCLAMVTPGPDMVLVMRDTFVGGRRAGLRCSFGVLTGNLVHISYCLLGIGWLISRSILAFATLKYAAAAYLIYLGVFTVVIAPGTSAGTMMLLVASMLLVSVSFWLLFVYTLDRPVVREWASRSQRAVNRAFGLLLIVMGVRVAFADR